MIVMIMTMTDVEIDSRIHPVFSPVSLTLAVCEADRSPASNIRVGTPTLFFEHHLRFHSHELAQT